MQTKKGKNSLQVAALNEAMTAWLLEVKNSGLASNEEVHMATPPGMLEVDFVIVPTLY